MSKKPCWVNSVTYSLVIKNKSYNRLVKNIYLNVFGEMTQLREHPESLVYRGSLETDDCSSRVMTSRMVKTTRIGQSAEKT